MKIWILLAFSLSIFGSVGLAQSNMNEALDSYFGKNKQGVISADMSQKLMTYNNEDLIDAVSHRTKDSVMDKRFAAYKLLNYIGHHVTRTALQKAAIKQIIGGLTDRDGGLVGVNLGYLTTFDAGNFDAELKYKIAELAKTSQPHYDMFIKIYGWLGTSDLIYDFRKAIEDKKGDTRSRWTMRLAMARMGEKDMVDYCLTRLQKIPLGDDMVYEVIPDIVYTRQKPLFDYLLDLIGNDVKNCSSPNPNSDAKLICGYRIMELVAPYIEGFPVEVGTSGDLKVKSYEQALHDVRDWIKLNREKYVMIKKGF